MWSVRSVVLFEKKKKRKKEKEVWEECRKLWRCVSLLYIEETCFFFFKGFFFLRLIFAREYVQGAP